MGEGYDDLSHRKVGLLLAYQENNEKDWIFLITMNLIPVLIKNYRIIKN